MCVTILIPLAYHPDEFRAGIRRRPPHLRKKAEIQYPGGVDLTSPLALAYLKVACVTNLGVYPAALRRAHRCSSSKRASLCSIFTASGLSESSTRGSEQLWYGHGNWLRYSPWENGRQWGAQEANRVHAEWALVCLGGYDNHRDTPAGGKSYSLFEPI